MIDPLRSGLGGIVSFHPTRPRRTPTYTLRPARRSSRTGTPKLRRRAPVAERVNTQAMLFDRPASLPTATIRSTSARAAFASHVRGIRTTGWRWARPRLVPALVAIVGMLAVLGAAEYLTHLARYTPEPPVAAIAAPIDSHAAPSVGRVMSLPGNAQQVRVVVLTAP